MFSRLANVIYNAVDALAPPLPLHEEFVWHWNAITKFYTEKTSSGKIPIESTNLPDHFNQMSAVLEQEEEESESGSMGLCMEYLLQHKVLETVAVLARADTPPGMKRYVLMFVGQLLSNSKHSLLPQINVCTPVQKLIKLCGEVMAAPSEREEIAFLDTICTKLQENPYLANCFLSDASIKSLKDKKKSEECSSNEDSMEYPLVKSLLSLLSSPDSEVSTKAGNCLILCTSVANDAVAMVIIKHTVCCQEIINRLTLLYAGIPKTLKPIDVDDAFAKWNHDLTPIVSDAQISPGKRRLLCFLKWLDFVDCLTQQSHPLIGDTLATSFQSDFLEAILYPDITEDDDKDIALLMTTVVSCCLRHISSPKLVNSFGVFLLGDTVEPDIPGYTGHLLKHLLIERCQNSSRCPQLGLATLQLFDELLHKPTEKIINNLILNNLKERNYYDFTAGDSYFDFSDDEESAHGRSLYDDDEISPGSSPVNRAFAPTHIHRILNCFLLLLPDEIKSCDAEDDSGYDTYINDAHRQFQECLMLCEQWDWPQELAQEKNTVEDDSSSDSQPEADSTSYFYEGDFLSMIFDKLEHMLEQPYEVNLQITSLVSRIALFPHPNLHEYLLNPLIPLTGCRSLFTVLLKVVEDIQVNIRKTVNFKKKLRLTRRALLSEAAEYSSFEDANILEALIVIEEFCKELAAIAFVKYHASS
ncbi:protein FAM160B1-like [Centruroides sculpturatus]|uniref:protein FAM160B1-like n=1 Tax=Centruroides sculpturatus TaxID=218467 RepID=UPI000C6ED380|nr:protein FAM160B1-like [Centruroides sculpturatus]